MPELSLAELAKQLDCELHGSGDTVITSLGTVTAAQTGQICFISNKNYIKYLADTQASAAIIAPELVEQCSVDALVTQDPYGTYAKLSLLFDDCPVPSAGVASSAVVDSSATIAASAAIGENAVIGAGAIIGEGVVVGAGTYIGEQTTIGANTRIFANVSIYHKVNVGADCLLHSGAVIGADGFGFAPTAQGWQRIAQIGGVNIGDRVSIGANTTIDRGAIDATVIGDDVIIDNQVQIAHNVVIGNKSAVAGASAIAGSTTIGERCIIGGGVGVVGHITIASGVTVTARTLVTKSITEAGSYSAGTPVMPTVEWRKAASVFKRLRSLLARVDALEKQNK